LIGWLVGSCTPPYVITSRTIRGRDCLSTIYLQRVYVAAPTFKQLEDAPHVSVQLSVRA